MPNYVSFVLEERKRAGTWRTLVTSVIWLNQVSLKLDGELETVDSKQVKHDWKAREHCEASHLRARHGVM